MWQFVMFKRQNPIVLFNFFVWNLKHLLSEREQKKIKELQPTSCQIVKLEKRAIL